MTITCANQLNKTRGKQQMRDKPFYVLVTGGRDYSDEGSVRAALHSVLMDVPADRRMVVVHGAARGADTLAGRWCDYWNQPEFRIPAEWDRFLKAAGGKRNQQMLNWLPIDLVVAFPGGSGTQDMVTRAEKANIKVIHAGANNK